MDLPYELRTPRLWLRRPRVSDAELAFARWTSDPEVTRYLTWRPHEDVSATRAWIEAVRAAWEAGGGHRAWVLVPADAPDDGPIGAIGMSARERAAILGYCLSRARWGEGLMTEAAGEVLAAVRGLGVRVESVCDVDNHASARVLRKIGMRFVGVRTRAVVHPSLGDAPRDVRAYACP